MEDDFWKRTLVCVTRIVWIVGLSFALFVFGGLAVLAVVALITRGHLNEKGIVMILGNGYIAWVTFQYLRFKITGNMPTPPVEDESVDLPRLT